LDTATSPYTVHYKDGRVQTDLGPFNDTNGNYFDTNGDTLQRKISLTSGTGPLTVTDSNGNSQTYSIQGSGQVSSTTQFPTTSCFGGKPIYQDTSGKGGTSTLTLPSGTTYVFTFDPTFNEVIKVVLPTGGYIRYQYVTLANWDQGPNYQSDCPRTLDSRRVSARFVSPDGNPQHEQQWQYSYGSLSVHQTTVTDPLDNVTVHSFGGSSDGMHETLTQYYDNAGHLLRTVAHSWTSDNGPVQAPLTGPMTCGYSATNWRMTSETTTLADTNQVKQVQTNFDSYTPGLGGCGTTTSRGNVLSTLEYDWGPGAPGPLLRRTVYTYLHDSNSNYITKHILDRVSSKTVYDSTSNQCQGQSRACAQTTHGYDGTVIATKSGVVQHDYTNFPSTMVYRGNPTTISHWRNTDGAFLTTTNYYDELGNLIQTTDPLSHSTYFDYTDSWSGTACIPSGGTANAFVTKITNALTQFTTAKYYPCSSLMAFTTDLNNQTSSFAYDGLDRLTQKTLPDGGIATNTYTDTALSSKVETKRKLDASRWTDSFVLFDGLGRVIAQSAANDEPTAWDRTDTCYDSMGRVSFTSYPYQTSSATSAPNCSSSVGDTFAYDPLSRATQITHSDGTSVLTTYTGRATQVQDEGNGTRRVSRVSQMDALGRPLSVCEVSSATLPVGASASPVACGQDIAATGFLTTYLYDALDNLTDVTQPGLNPRHFTYDSLFRLLTAANPESGTTTYVYDSDAACPTPNSFAGDLIKKVDARGVRICMQYDALNRLSQKNYSDSTPMASFTYDQTSAYGVSLANTVGRISSETTASPNPTAKIFSYDQLGRVKINSQCTPQNCSANTVFPINYTYDLLGDWLSSTNGEGVTLSYTYNIAPRLLTLSSNYGNSPPTLFSAAHYNAAGKLTGASLNNGALTETRAYDARLRLASLTAGALHSVTIPATGGYAPNGDILLANDSVNGNWTYAYDDFNRLLSANATGQAYTYDYDRYGNRWHQNGPYSSQLGFDANNRVTGVTGLGYDLAGDMTGDGSGPGTHTYFYDAENRIIQVDGTLGTCSTATACYVYNAEGQRVRKTTGSTSVDFLYDLGGNEITQISSGGIWQRGEVYAGSRHLANYSNGTTYFVHADWLGTERVRSTRSGLTFETCTGLPFGDALTCVGPDYSPMHFTGKERDAESGLNNFGARYDSSSMGRFMSPDSPSYSNHKNPQSWNLYAFALNNPVTFRDADGHKVECLNNVEQCKKDARRSTGKDVQVQTVQDKPNWLQRLFHMQGTTHNYLTIPGDTSGFAPGSNAAKLAALIADPRTVSVSYSRFANVSFNFTLDTHGGSTSLLPSQRYTSDARAWIDPANQDYDGIPRDQDAIDQRISEANTAEEFGHEILGHIWGELIGGHPAGTRANMRDSIIGENAVRALDPTRGQKGPESHHNMPSE